MARLKAGLGPASSTRADVWLTAAYWTCGAGFGVGAARLMAADAAGGPPSQTPRALAALVDPTNSLMIGLLFALLAGALAAYLRRARLRRRGPTWKVLVPGVLSVVTLALALPGYGACRGPAAPAWTALSRTMGLFNGEFAEPFGLEPGCSALTPLGVQMGRITGQSALLLALLGAITHVFADRLAVARLRLARQIVLVGGIDQTTLPFLERVMADADGRPVVVVCEPQDELTADAARSVGAVPVSALWHDRRALERVTVRRGAFCLTGASLMAPDATTNLDRLEILTSIAAAFPRPPGGLPTRGLVRVDDPWQAEYWRRAAITHPGWIIDTLSLHEVTAAHLADAAVAATASSAAVCLVVPNALTGLTSPPSVGGHPHGQTGALALALCAEFARREREFWLAADGEPSGARDLVLLGPGGPDVLAQHRARAGRFGIALTPGIRAPQAAGSPVAPATKTGQTGSQAPQTGDSPLTATPKTGRFDLPTAPTAGPASMAPDGDGWEAYAATLDHPTVILLADWPDAILAAETLALRHPTWTIFQYDLATGGVGGRPVMENLTTVGPTIDLATHHPADTWERVARIAHRRYLAGLPQRDPNRPTHRRWDELPALTRESAIRQVSTTLSSTVALGYSWLIGPQAAGAAGTTGGDGVGGFRPDELEILARREHQEWCTHLRHRGWHQARQRDDARRRHDRLVEWDELDDQARRQTVEGVQTCLAVLAEMGYRPVRVDVAVVDGE